MTTVTILGPQRLLPTIGQELARESLAKRQVAVVTAGWQEREDEDRELREVVRLPVVNLRLYERWEKLLAADPEYFALHRERQDRLRVLQRLYRLRLSPLMASARMMLERSEHAEVLAPIQEEAIAAVRTLDDHHFARVQEVLDRFITDVRPGDRPAIAEQRAELRQIVQGCGAVVVAGGNVAVLANRLELFAFDALLPGRRVFAWSAGAMALTARIVLFHDSPPQGAGDAEILSPGSGLLPGIVVLPHARHRLQLSDLHRVELMARRFSPARCVPLDEGDALTWSEATGLVQSAGGRWMGTDGAIVAGDAA